MIKSTTIQKKLGVSALLLLSACSAGNVDESETTATQKFDILNGTVDSTNTKREAVHINGNCSGAILTNSWILTANHCIRDANPVTVTYGSQTATSTQVFRHPSDSGFTPGAPDEHQGVDVLLLKLNHPFTLNGSPGGYARALWPLDSNDLAGRQVEIDGWGLMDTQGDGTQNLRYALLSIDPNGVRKDVLNGDGVDTGDIVTFDNNNPGNPRAGQLPLPGDSGSGDFIDAFGTTYQASITIASDTTNFVNAWGLSTATSSVRSFVDHTTFAVPSTIPNFSIYSNPCVSSHGRGTLDGFWVDPSKHLRYSFFDGSFWGNTVDLGTPPGVTLGGNKPASISMSSNRIDVFAQTTNNQLYMRSRVNNVWGAWTQTPGVTATSGPSVASWGPNRMDLFVRGAQNDLLHSYYDGSWHFIWESLGGVLSSSPAAVSWGSNRIDISVRGTDNGVYLKSWDGSWHDWVALGGTMTAGPAISSYKPGRLDFFAQGQNGNLLHRWWEGQFVTEWIDTGYALPGVPTSVSWGPGRIDIVSISPTGTLWTTNFPS